MGRADWERFHRDRWGGSYTQTGTAVSVRDAGWNGALGAGATTSVGFLGSSSGSTGVPAVTCTSR
ncbi:cellulose binding domain-containing protein [Micromonospora sp. U56]|uniref:cellulose binding domain-containing protein n=1 Tax=Micromonospora sp. U56 TaxID=2824900 RepID=UPI001B36C209|nr:cellulose binding domain-containing protein [Micromonospora sp. U56]MBQ0893922.1 cellulose binding domain-containing protein [Micromonospora sp. U56]